MIHDRIKLNVDNYIAHVILSRPDKMNALDNAMFEAIPMVGERLRADPSIRVVVVSGDGGNFCAGLDKSNFSSMLAKSAAEKSLWRFGQAHTWYLQCIAICRVDVA